MIKRIGSHLFTLLLLSVMVGGSVVVARAIDWKELIDNFKEAANPGAVEKEKRKKRRTTSHLQPGNGSLAPRAVELTPGNHEIRLIAG